MEIPTDSPSSLGHVSIGVTACFCQDFLWVCIGRLFYYATGACVSVRLLGMAFQDASPLWDGAFGKCHKNQLNYKHIESAYEPSTRKHPFS